jgi:hypothetical protein
MPLTSNPKVGITSYFYILIHLGNDLKMYTNLNSCAKVDIISITLIKS